MYFLSTLAALAPRSTSGTAAVRDAGSTSVYPSLGAFDARITKNALHYTRGVVAAHVERRHRVAVGSVDSVPRVTVTYDFRDAAHPDKTVS